MYDSFNKKNRRFKKAIHRRIKDPNIPKNVKLLFIFLWNNKQFML